MSRQFKLLATILRVLLGAGGLVFLIGPVVLPDHFGSSNTSLAGAVLLISLVLYAGFRPGQTSSEPGEQRRDLGKGDVEPLHDLHWEIREAEARYRDLLDRQTDIILRRNARGMLTFVNRAFCTTFGVAANKVLGTAFEPKVLEQDGPDPEPTSESRRQRQIVQRVETAAGPRWIAWEECTAPAAAGGHETQRVGRDVTEQHAASAMLARAREQAEETSQAKSRFLAAMGSEIRAPVDEIVGLTGRLQATELSPEQAACTEVIAQSAQSLLALMDEIIEFSKLDAGKIELNAAPFELEICIRNAVEQSAAHAYQKGLEIGWSMDPAVPVLLVGDEVRIREALHKLIRSAVRQTERGGVLVSVRATPARAEQATITFRIEDTSAGLDLDQAAVAPGDHEQIPRPSASVAARLGLDLAIARRLARALGGKIVVENEPGRGSLVTFELPLTIGPDQQHGAAMPPVAHVRALVCSALDIEKRALMAELRAAGAVVTAATIERAEAKLTKAAQAGEAFSLIFVDGDADVDLAGQVLAIARDGSPDRHVRGCVLIKPQQRTRLLSFRRAGFEDHLLRPIRRSSLRALVSTREHAAGDAASPIGVQTEHRRDRHSSGRILVAEDNAVNALLTQCMIRRAACTSVLVETGRAAVDAVRRSMEGTDPAIDLVLMDVHMPDMNGLEAAREIRALRHRLPGKPGNARACPPLIAVTANAYADDRASCLEAGMDDYLAKPFSWPEFESLLARWLPHADNDGSAPVNDDAA